MFFHLAWICLPKEHWGTLRIYSTCLKCLSVRQAQVFIPIQGKKISFSWKKQIYSISEYLVSISSTTSADAACSISGYERLEFQAVFHN